MYLVPERNTGSNLLTVNEDFQISGLQLLSDEIHIAIIIIYPGVGKPCCRHLPPAQISYCWN